MSEHNPFKELGKRFRPQETPDAAAGSGAKTPGGKVPGAKTHTRASSPAKDDDAGLFLSAVHGIAKAKTPKAPIKTPGEEENTLFANAMKAVTPMAAKKQPHAPSKDGASAASASPPAPLQEQAEPLAEGDDGLFSAAMRGVTPVAAKGREIAASSEGASPRIIPEDPAKALRDLLEGRIEFALHLTDEYVEGFVAGVDPLTLNKLRAGQFSPEAHLDLHGQNADQALDSLMWFVKNAYQRNMRTILIITGRGKNSPDGVGVLRRQLQQWLTKDPFKRVVLAFCTAVASDGGPGAVYVLLRKYKKNHGKIIWERGPAEEDHA